MDRADELLRRWLAEPAPIEGFTSLVGTELNASDEDAEKILFAISLASENAVARGFGITMAAHLAFVTGLALARYARELDDEALS